MRRETKEIAQGIFICFALNLLYLGITGYFGASDFLLHPHAAYPVRVLIANFLFAALGLLQLAYVVPLVSLLRKKGYLHVGKGMIIGASLTFLLCATCWGIIAVIFQ